VLLFHEIVPSGDKTVTLCTLKQRKVFGRTYEIYFFKSFNTCTDADRNYKL
jgi:hypothetical protein